MIYEISYANDKFRETQKLHVRMAKKYGGFDKIIAYGEDDLGEKFREDNKDILSLPRGGYWIWKPHIINMTLEKMQENDYVLYADTGSVILHSVKKLISVMEKNHDDIMAFEVYGRMEREYTKRDVFKYFGYETEECLNSNQIMGGFILIRKNSNTERIFKEYEKAVVQANLLLDGDNILTTEDNYPEFKAHRHDQSILSVLLKKNGINPYRDPSQWGLYQSIRYKQKLMNKPEEYTVYKKSKYPKMMFYLHRNGTYNPENMYVIYKDILMTYKAMIAYWIDKNKIV